MHTDITPRSPDAIMLTPRERALWRFLARWAPFIASVAILLGCFGYLLLPFL